MPGVVYVDVKETAIGCCCVMAATGVITCTA